MTEVELRDVDGQRPAGPPLIDTSEAAFAHNHRIIGRLVEGLEYAARHRLVHTTGDCL